ncbi:MAG: AraC family transcriptional regulator [Limnohabitans sp.]|nr:AraC family transcriptional regulator [Limnohabitans sp.]
MKKFIACLVLFLICFQSISQVNTFKTITEKDFLKLQEKAKSFLNSDVDSAFFYVKILENSHNDIYKASGFVTHSYILAKQNKFADAEIKCSTAIKLISNASASPIKSQTESYIYNVSGLVDWMNQKLPNALDKFFMAKKIAIKNGDIVQINKINLNIANIKRDIGNFKEAISNYKESDQIIDKNKNLYSKFDFLQNKANLNFNLGICYERFFAKNRNKNVLLDSAYFFYSKAQLYSDDNLSINLNVLNNLGNIHFFKGEYVAAEKNYMASSSLAKQSNSIKEYYSALYNLGLVNYITKNYDKALIYFARVDSIYKLSNSGKREFVDSNYKQAKIFESRKDYEKALHHSQIYTENFEKDQGTANNNIVEANFKLTNEDIKKEMILLQNKYRNRVFYQNAFFGFMLLVIIVLMVLYIRKYRSKKVIEKKMEIILNEIERNSVVMNNADVSIDETEAESDKDKVGSQLISIESESEILNKLRDLEEKKFYLNQNFTQQQVAKKIKTNTTYLSYVVNKHFGKSFGGYYNELRINYIINEIVNNSKFREYTTQAIAESAGFKNADSFTTSFKKKTGLTPFQFINEIKKRES